MYASEKAMNWPAKALPTPLEVGVTFPVMAFLANAFLELRALG